MKTKSLGMEFKTSVSVVLYTDNLVEIHEGKQQMKLQYYFKGLGTMAAYVCRLFDASLWFDSNVPVCTELGNSSVLEDDQNDKNGKNPDNSDLFYQNGLNGQSGVGQVYTKGLGTLRNDIYS